MFHYSLSCFKRQELPMKLNCSWYTCKRRLASRPTSQQRRNTTEGKSKGQRGVRSNAHIGVCPVRTGNQPEKQEDSRHVRGRHKFHGWHQRHLHAASVACLASSDTKDIGMRGTVSLPSATPVRRLSWLSLERGLLELGGENAPE